MVFIIASLRQEVNTQKAGIFPDTLKLNHVNQEMKYDVQNLLYIKISDTINVSCFNRLLSCVSKKKQEQVQRFHHDIDKKLSLYSEIAVRAIICQTLNVSNHEIVFVQTQYGKPYLEGYPDCHFNLSHTRNAIAVIISDKPAGVDIEKIAAADLQIAKRFFTENEAAYIETTDIGKDKRFYEVWTKKEAYIKYKGKGLSMALNSFDVLCDTISKQIQTFQINDYIISACGEYSEFQIIEISEMDVERMAADLV